MNNSPNIRESHLHTFHACKRAKEIWDGLKNIIAKINPKNICENGSEKYFFLGSKSRGKNDILLNTLTSITVNSIWHARCKLKKEKVLIRPQKILNGIVQTFKLRLIQFHEIYKRREQTRKFKRKFQITELFTINDDEKISFNF